MRLGVVTSGFPFTNKETFLTPELRELATASDVYIYPVNPVLRSPLFDTGATSVRMPVASVRVIWDAMRELFERPARVARAYHALAPAHSAWRVRLKNTAIFAKALAVARDMRRRRVEHVHAYWASTSASVAHAVALINGIPWSFTAHRWDIYEDNVLAGKVRDAAFVRAISERSRGLVLSRADPGGDAEVTALHLGVTGPPALADDGAAKGSQPARTDRPFTLLCAASLEPVKGHATLLDALQRVACRGMAIRCVLAGDGSLRNSIATAVAALGLSNTVILAGTVPYERLLDDLAHGVYDAGVLASIETPNGLHEGIPVFLMEAMAAGVPCVATRTGGIAELIDSRCGLLVEQRDPEALADAIQRLSVDAALRRELGSAARSRIARDFAAPALARRLLAKIEGASTR